MKWESAPLWPVVLPSVTGLILAFIPYIFQTDYFTTRNLLTPVIILALVGLLVFLLNEKFGNPLKNLFKTGGEDKNTQNQVKENKNQKPEINQNTTEELNYGRVSGTMR